jgi:hypothetical protein
MFDSDYERNRFLEGTQNKTSQGTIYGKCLLISQALGPKARDRLSLPDNDNTASADTQLAA